MTLRFMPSRLRNLTTSSVIRATEPLEPRVLLAADAVLANDADQLPAYAYIFYALSRGGDQLMSIVESPSTNVANNAKPITKPGPKSLVPALSESTKSSDVVPRSRDNLLTAPPSESITTSVVTNSESGSNSQVIPSTDTVAGPSMPPIVTVPQAEAENGDLVRFRTEAIDLAGNVVTEVTVGDSFLVRVFVQDIREDTTGNRGVFAAYIDFIYDFSLAQLNGESMIGSDFPNGQSLISPFTGLFNDAGGAAGGTPTGTGELLLMQVPLQATSVGSFQVVVDEADLSPQRDVLLFGLNTPVSEDEVEYNGLTIDFVDSNVLGDPNLVQFAMDLTAAGVTLYDADWCPNCAAQKELFEDGSKYLLLIEATNPDRTLNQTAQIAGIDSYPTWVFSDGSQLNGIQSLETISQQSGVAIPMGDDPYFTPIEDLTVFDNAPLHVGIDGYDPNGGPLTYTVTSDNRDVVEASILEGNQSMRVRVAGFGDMVFELFEGRAPRATREIIDLANDNFYDELTFHRVANMGRSNPNDSGVPFVIQGGDPSGNGSGGPGFQWDDDFDVELTHLGSGILSMAKSFDDTNGSQFFVTASDTRFLDFNHSVFGKLVEGEAVRTGIQRTATEFDSFSRDTQTPLFPVTINTMDIFDDTENAMLMLKAAPGAVGSANITVTVTDSTGLTFHHTFAANAASDPANGSPFLEDIDPVETLLNTPVSFQLPAVDAESDPIEYNVVPVGSAAEIEVSDQGLVTVTPPDDFLGELTLRASIRQDTSVPSTTGDKVDTQIATVSVLPTAPTNISLTNSSDTGVSSDDNITNTSDVDIKVDGVVDGAIIEVFLDGQSIGTTTAVGNQALLNADLAGFGEGTFSLTALFTSGELTSPTSSDFSLTIDRTEPQEFTSVPPTSISEQEQLVYDADTPEEGTDGYRYSLIDAPLGATIEPLSGIVNWTPTGDQAGTFSFSVLAADAAGNAITQPITLNVENDVKLRVRLETSDLQGNEISSIPVGHDFLLNVFVSDLRQAPAGIQSAFVDVTYDTVLASVSGAIQHGASFGENASGQTDTPGLIDNAGSAISSASLGEEQLFNVRLTANGIAGPLTFASVFADHSPETDVLLVGATDPLSANEIELGTATIDLELGLTALDDMFEIDEDQPTTTLSVLANDSLGVQGGAFVIAGIDFQGVPGELDIPNDSSGITFKPNADYNGTFTFRYTVSDGLRSTASADVTVVVNPVNDLPAPTNDIVTTDEDTVLVIEIDNLLSNDVAGPENESDQDLRLFLTSSAFDNTLGVLEFPGDGTLVYTPPRDFVGDDTFVYQANDLVGGATDATVTISVLVNVNDPPVTTNDNVTTTEDTSVTILKSDLLANDLPGPVNESSQSLTLFISLGELSENLVVTDDAIIYTPSENFVGMDSFQYTAVDNGSPSLQSSGTVFIEVTPVNDPPVADDDQLNATEDIGPVTIDVLVNDVDAVDGETLTVAEVSQGDQGGIVTISEDGKTVIYQPPADFNGVETFTYTADDGGENGTDQAVVTVTVGAVNDPPTPAADAVDGQEDIAVVISVSELLQNDAPGPADEVDQTLTLSLPDNPDVAGTLDLFNGQITYTPTTNFSGTTTFVYEVADDGVPVESATATVTISMAPENDPPGTGDDEAQAFHNGDAVVIDVLVNDSDIDADKLTIISVQNDASEGIVTIINDGKNIQYEPATGFVGIDTFAYTIQDVAGATAEGTVTVNVMAAGEISGTVFLDTNNNGIQDNGEVGLANVEIIVQSDNDGPDNVITTVRTDASGRYEFGPVMPGNYTITESQPEFILDGGEILGSIGGIISDNDQFSLSIDSSNIDAVDYNFAELGVHPMYSYWFATAGSMHEGLVAAIDSDGSTAWYLLLEGWSSLSSVDLSLDVALSNLTINAIDFDGNAMNSSFALGEVKQARRIGQSDSGLQLLQIVGDNAELSFETVPASVDKTAAVDAAFSEA